MRKLIVMTVLVIMVLSACKQQGYKDPFQDPFIFSKTVKALNEVVMQNNFPPIIASRNYTYAAIAAYEVMVLGDHRFQSLAGQIKHLPPVPPQDTLQVNFNYASLLAYCKVGQAVTFPEGSMTAYVNGLDSIADAAGMDAVMKQASKKLADSVANHILRWSKKDNYAQTRTAEKFNITQTEGRWVPTPPMYAQALEPHWNEIRAMVMDSASEFTPPPPPVFDMKDKSRDRKSTRLNSSH